MTISFPSPSIFKVSDTEFVLCIGNSKLKVDKEFLVRLVRSAHNAIKEINESEYVNIEEDESKGQ